jgi:hypothetical protein
MHCELSSTVDESGASPSRLDTSIDPSGTVDPGLRHHSTCLAQCLLHLWPWCSVCLQHPARLCLILRVSSPKSLPVAAGT